MLRHFATLRTERPEIPLRPFVPLLITTLEDPDASVRDAARESTIEIFSHPAVSPAARADLKKELAKRGVRKATADAVLSAVLGGHSTPLNEDATSDAGSVRSVDGHAQRSSLPGERGRTTPVNSISVASSAPTTDSDTLEPHYVRWF
jgi:CLIP-associating protein 1/2